MTGAEITTVEAARELSVRGGLSASAAARVVASVPQSTRDAYSSDWRGWVTWCAIYEHLALPAGAESIAEYASYLADAGKAYATIDRALAAIASAHRAAGETPPDSLLARKVLRAYARERAEAGIPAARKATPVTVSVLRAMTAVCSPYTPIGVRDRAVLVLGFALGARRSELAALNISDITETPAGLEVVIRTSKTDIHSQGRHVAIPYGTYPPTCPIRTLRAWRKTLTERGRDTTGPLFVRIDRHHKLGHVATGRGSTDGRLTGRAIANIIQRTAQKAGQDPDQCWTGHSLRRGMATETYRNGADPLHIARHGGWKDGSRALLGYIEDTDKWTTNPLTGIGL